MFAVFLFIASVVCGIGVCMARSLVLLFVILVLQMSFVQTVPACRGYEKVWAFALFSGSMVPVHLLWFFPSVISIGVFDAYDVATAFMVLYVLFSVELFLVLFLTHCIARHRRKYRVVVDSCS